MILKTEVLFSDVMAEKLGTDEKMIWGLIYVDLKEIVAFGEYMINGQPDPSLTEVIIKNVGGRILNIPVSEFKMHMDKIWRHREYIND